jgi:nucleoid DNA-binding protein
MAKEIQAVRAYTPRVVQGKLVEMSMLAQAIAARTSFNTGAILNMLYEFKEVLTEYALSGFPVRLEGLGIFSPTVNKEREFDLNYRTDVFLKSELNKRGAFRGVMKNRDMIGKSLDDMIERWNREHPDDKIKRDKKAEK